MAHERTCPICNTVNEADYIYCKNCGTQLPPVAAAQPAPPPIMTPPPVTYTPPTTYAPPVQTPPAGETDTVCGVSTLEATAFIGSNANTYIPTFKKMDQGASAGWNWPVFLFSFFLNIPFVWFFYRKMYKVGAWVLAASLALTVATTVCCSAMMNTVMGPAFEFLNQSQELLHAYAEGKDILSDPALGVLEEEFADIIANGIIKAAGCILALSLLGLAQLVFTILLSVFANKMYYTHCVKKLHVLRQQYAGRIPPAPLRIAGGTNTGIAVTLGIVVPMITGIILSLPMLQFFGMLLQAVEQYIYF